MNNGRNNGGIYIYTAQSLTENLKVEVFTEFHLSGLLSSGVFIPLYNQKGLCATQVLPDPHSSALEENTSPQRVSELLPEEAWINITPPLHPPSHISFIIHFIWPFWSIQQVSKRETGDNASTNALGKGEGIGVSPEEQPSLWVSGDSVSGDVGGEKPGQTNPSEACLIVTEFPAGMTLKNHPQEESWDVRKTFSGSICLGELRLCRVCAQGPGPSLSRQNTATFLILRRQDQPIQHISVPSSTAHYLLLCSSERGGGGGIGNCCLGQPLVLYASLTLGW